MYEQNLTQLDQQIRSISQFISVMPAGNERDRFASQLSAFKADARHTLHKLLPQLNVAERVATTNELRRLGDTVPSLQNVLVAASANGSAIISISGTNFQPGASLTDQWPGDRG